MTSVLLGGMLTLNAQITDLLISEYVEGSSNNKYVELYNGTGSPIDLGGQNYRIEVYANGANTPTSIIPLTGTVAAGGVYVLGHPSATAWNGTPNQTSNGLNYNGNDAVALRKGAALLDLIGNIGCMPDIEWGAGLVSTADNTIRRKPAACLGVTADPPNSGCPFPTLALDWDGFDMDVVSGLGFHQTTCNPVPEVGFTLAASSLIEGNSGVTNHPVAVTMNLPPAATVTVTVSNTNTGTATNGVDYTFSSSTLTFSPAQPYPATQFVQLPVIGDTQAEPDETVVLSLSVSGGQATPTLATHTVTIVNDDAPSVLYSQGDGLWSMTNGWNSMPDGSGIYVTDPNNTQGPSGPVYHCIIQPGHDIILPGTRGITTLTVQTGGTLKAGTTTSRYLEIYGNAVTVNGVMGNGAANDGIGLEFHGPSATISGAGTIDLNRIRKNGFTATSIVIARSLQLRYAGGAALYNDIAGYPFNVTIQPGATVTVTRGDVSIDGVDGSNSSHRWGTFSILGTLDIQLGKLFLRTDNATAGSQDIHYIVGPGATLKVGGQVVGAQGLAGNAKAHLTLQGGSQLVLTGAGEVMASINPARDPVSCQANSTVDYAGAAAQFVEDEITYANLRSSGGGLKTLEGATTLNGFLLLVAGHIRLLGYDLLIGPGGQSGPGSAASYVQTNGTGRLRQTVGASTRLFPVGNGAYNLLTLTNTGTSDVFSVQVEDAAPEPAMVVSRIWTVEEATPGGSNVTLSLQWNQPEELPGFTRSDCYISRHTPGGWNGDTPGPATGSNPWYRLRSGLSEFGAFAVGSSLALPVEWLSFEAEPLLPYSVHLTWRTASESDNEGFEVQRSEDAKNWEVIGFVPGAGTTSEVQTYNYTDPSPFTLHPSPLYYRLKQRDYDGSLDYSPIRVVEIAGGPHDWVAYPNPASGVMYLRFEEETSSPRQLRLSDRIGRPLLEQVVSPGITFTEISLETLPPGFYLLEVTLLGRVSWRGVVVY